MTILSPITQFALDNAGRNDGEANDPNMYVGILAVHSFASIAGPAKLATMSSPHPMSYAYRGLPIERFGMAASIKSRKQFQIASSQAYRLGSKVGGRVGLAKFGGRMATRAIPGIGWALLAYDAYDLVANRRLFGIEL